MSFGIERFTFRKRVEKVYRDKKFFSYFVGGQLVGMVCEFLNCRYENEGEFC